MQPVLPLESVNVTVPRFGTVRRRLPRHVHGHERHGAVDGCAGDRAARHPRAVLHRCLLPAAAVDVELLRRPQRERQTQLHVTPVQHRSESPKMTRRKFADMDFRLFYSNNSASYCGSRPNTADPPPCADGSDRRHAGAHGAADNHGRGHFVDNCEQLTFRSASSATPWPESRRSGSRGRTRPKGAARGVAALCDLVQDEDDPTLWTGTLDAPTGTGPSDVFFLVHAANGVGRVTTDDNLGASTGTADPRAADLARRLPRARRWLSSLGRGRHRFPTPCATARASP